MPKPRVNLLSGMINSIRLSMFNTSPHTLKILAASVWLSGVLVLLYKSSSFFLEAARLEANPTWLTLAIISGLLIGLIKAKYLFSKLCIKNLKRIYALEKPKLWQFYRLPFFLFLGLMITLGSYFSRIVQGDITMLISLAVLELSVGIALLGSSYYFWKQ